MRRLRQLGSAFAVDVYAYAVMSNHFHLVVYLDPSASQKWSDLEVAERWLRVCPPKMPDGTIDEDLLVIQRDSIVGDPARLALLRGKLASLSVFMKLLKQPIARRANIEDDCTGHFFEQRFYSGALLTEEAVLAAMAYVDLNPIRAKIARTIEDAKHTSIHERLSATECDLSAYLQPVVAGLGAEPSFHERLEDYVERLDVLLPASEPQWSASKLKRWQDQVFHLKRRQRAFGSSSLIDSWFTARGWRRRELPLPN